MARTKKDKNNILKLPFVKTYKRGQKKPEVLLKKLLDMDFKNVVVIGIRENGKCVTNSTFAKPAQTFAAMDIAKDAYIRSFSAKYILTGKMMVDDE